MPRKVIPNLEFANNPRELCRDQLIKLALEAFNKANGKLSIRKAALEYRVPWERVRDRKNGMVPRKEANQAM
jgi:hypothetical protein